MHPTSIVGAPSSIGICPYDDGGVEVSSTKREDNLIKIVSREGREQIIKP